MGTSVAPTLWSPASGVTSEEKKQREREIDGIAAGQSPDSGNFVAYSAVLTSKGSSQAARAIRTAALGGDCSRSTGGLSTGWSLPALQEPRGYPRTQGRFILGGASHLDAFSGYLRLPSLPGGAPGGTAGTRAGSPTRSSRTRVRTPQSSNAHDGYRPNCLTTF